MKFHDIILYECYLYLDGRSPGEHLGSSCPHTRVAGGGGGWDGDGAGG